MIKTLLINDQTDSYVEFKNNIFLPSTYKKINYNEKFRIVGNILSSTNRIKMFKVSNGDVLLKHLNHIYCLEYMPVNCDIILPDNPKRLDWVVLHYEPGTIADFKYNEIKKDFQKFVIRSKKERIMGLDENLYCDMPFVSLRFTYIDKQDGWVIT